MTVREALAAGNTRLKSPCPAAFIDTPSLDASILLAETLKTTRTALILRSDESIGEAELEKFKRFLERRRNGECVAYILGRREFRELDFAVNSHVLVPRPETETLVEAALEYIDGMAHNAATGNISVLDLCAGSGALAISLKNERPGLQVTAADISAEALEVAARNASGLLGEKPAVAFIRSDLFENVPGRFNIIVSNPPYVPSDELLTLAPEVRREPRLALDGGEDGLDLIRKIISRARNYLSPRGILLLEASPAQMPAIKTLLENHGFDRVKVYKDLAGMERVISGRVLRRKPDESRCVRAVNGRQTTHWRHRHAKIF